MLGPRILHWLLPMLLGERRDMAARLVVTCLAPLAILYAAGLRAYLSLYDLGIRHRYRLPCCVVSIGNLVSGGTGKTGLAITVAKRLRDVGLRVCVLSRGFRGSYRGAVAAVSTGEEVLLGPTEAGDEPYLLAKELPGVPVMVGKDRRETGMAAVERFAPDVILLDDGMQYYQLERDVEVVLLAGDRPFGNGWTLPAGVLREPPSHLRRASVVVFNVCEGTAGGGWSAEIARRAPRALLLQGGYRPSRLVDVAGNRILPLEVLRHMPVATLCGLGNPASFECTVRSTGARLVRRFRLLDHRPPTAEEALCITDQAAQEGASALVITAKDAVKWPRLQTCIPVWRLEAEFVVDDLDKLVGAIQEGVRRHAERVQL